MPDYPHTLNTLDWFQFDPDYMPFVDFDQGSANLGQVYKNPVADRDLNAQDNADARFNSGVVNNTQISDVTRDPASDIGRAADGVGPAQARLDAVREQSPVQPVRQPQQVTNGALAIPAAAGVSASVDLIAGPLQQGVIRDLCLNLTGFLSTTAGSLTVVQLTNTYGQILFSATLATSSASAQPFQPWNFADLYVPFKQGLRLSVATGTSAGNAGELSVSVVWEH